MSDTDTNNQTTNLLDDGVETTAPQALRFEIPSLDEVDESLSPFYHQYEGKYRLKVEGVDDAKELKTALQKERAQSKEAKERLRQLEQARKEEERRVLEEKQEFKSLWEQEQARAKEVEQEYLSFKEQIAQQNVRNEALSIAASEGAGDYQTELLSEQIQKHIKMVDGNTIYEVGGVSVDKTDLVNHLKSKYPVLFRATGSSGGGTTGSVSSSGVSNGSRPQGNFGGSREERKAAIAAKFNLK